MMDKSRVIAGILPVIASEARQSIPAKLLPWLTIILGLAVMYLPSLYDLSTGIWNSGEQVHGLIVLGISLSLITYHFGDAAGQGKFSIQRPEWREPRV